MTIMTSSSCSDLPGLTAEAIDELARHWDDGGLWADIEWLADEFLVSTGADRLVSWHHLVVAIGNFKRQPGRRLRPPPLTTAAANRPLRVPTVAIPTDAGHLTLSSSNATSWERLQEQLWGAAAATTTALLAALWPTEHLICDWRVRAAANGLRIQHGLSPTAGLQLDSTTNPPLTLRDYAELRKWVTTTARANERPVHAVERSLYEVSRRIKDDSSRVWQLFGEETARVLDQLP